MAKIDRYSWLRGKAILIESIALCVINLLFFCVLYFIFNIDISKTGMVPSEITDRIAILTSSVISIGFLYYIGHMIALSKNKNPYIKSSPQSLQYNILFNGSLFFLAIFLSFLFFYLIRLGQLYIIFYILMNISIVMVAGYVNIAKASPNISTVSKVFFITTAVDETSNSKPTEDLRLLDMTSEDYRFLAENGDLYIIPIAQVKKIIITGYYKQEE